MTQIVRRIRSDKALESLTAELRKTSPGKIRDAQQLSRLLADSWSALKVSNGRMEGSKLVGRMEKVQWDPPELTFTIERHGSTVLGSSRAELQTWTVNIDRCKAVYEGSTYRQLQPREPALRVEPLAEEIRDLIVRNKEDQRLKWANQGEVRVKIGEIIPSGSAMKQTVQARRKRLRNALTKLLAQEGWQEFRPNVYVKLTSSGERHTK